MLQSTATKVHGHLVRVCVVEYVVGDVSGDVPRTAAVGWSRTAGKSVYTKVVRNRKHQRRRRNVASH